jgi:hypothetical protein
MNGVPQGTDNTRDIVDARPCRSRKSHRGLGVGTAEVVWRVSFDARRPDWSAAMAMTIEDRYAPLRFPFSVSLGRRVAALVTARQRRADERVAAYLRGLPDNVISKLGISPADMQKLRRCGGAPPPGLYGRVSVISALRSTRY